MERRHQEKKHNYGEKKEERQLQQFQLFRSKRIEDSIIYDSKLQAPSCPTQYRCFQTLNSVRQNSLELSSFFFQLERSTRFKGGYTSFGGWLTSQNLPEFSSKHLRPTHSHIATQLIYCPRQACWNSLCSSLWSLSVPDIAVKVAQLHLEDQSMLSTLAALERDVLDVVDAEYSLGLVSPARRNEQHL